MSAQWPAARLGEALDALARAGGLAVRDAALGPPPALLGQTGREARSATVRWLDVSTGWLDLEMEAVFSSFAELPAMIANAGPAIIRIEQDAEVLYFALLSSRRGRATLLGPDLQRYSMTVEALTDLVCARIKRGSGAEIGAMLDGLGLSADRRRRAERKMLEQSLGHIPIAGIYLIRTPPGASFWTLLREARVPRATSLLIAAQVLLSALSTGAWALLGHGALQGRLEAAWLMGWGLLLLTSVPLRMLAVWAQGQIAINGGAQLKRRLLFGALRLAPEEIRTEGMGHLLGRVIESEAVEALALSGGLGAALSLVELAVAAFVLTQGAGGAPHAAMLVAWAVLAVGLGARWLRKRDRWTALRLDITHGLVERMVGHRTRLAQEQPSRWHVGEDESIARYAADASQMDRAAAVLGVVVPRGWLLVALAGLLPVYARGDSDLAGFAISVGGVLLAQQALTGLTGGLVALGGAMIAWKQVAPLFAAGRREERRGSPALAVQAAADGPANAPLLHAVDLSFRYPGRRNAVLEGCQIDIRRGDRVLLEGPSGGGKSTLAALLVGLRQPEGGLLLLGGLDQASLGTAAWRRRVVAAPQFHENHVFSETFSFNLLMGRSWPPQPEDLQAADEICAALGLGPLLARMPAGMSQMVGETGWQLSHGERSRLFLARALLQGADIVVLDESFAALDPENLARALQTALATADTLVVIAHP